MTGLAGFGPFVAGELYDVLIPDVKHAAGYTLQFGETPAFGQIVSGAPPKTLPEGPAFQRCPASA